MNTGHNAGDVVCTKGMTTNTIRFCRGEFDPDQVVAELRDVMGSLPNSSVIATEGVVPMSIACELSSLIIVDNGDPNHWRSYSVMETTSDPAEDENPD